MKSRSGELTTSNAAFPQREQHLPRAWGRARRAAAHMTRCPRCCQSECLVPAHDALSGLFLALTARPHMTRRWRSLRAPLTARTDTARRAVLRPPLSIGCQGAPRVLIGCGWRGAAFARPRGAAEGSVRRAAPLRTDTARRRRRCSGVIDKGSAARHWWAVPKGRGGARRLAEQGRSPPAGRARGSAPAVRERRWGERGARSSRRGLALLPPLSPLPPFPPSPFPLHSRRRRRGGSPGLGVRRRWGWPGFSRCAAPPAADPARPAARGHPAPGEGPR